MMSRKYLTADALLASLSDRLKTKAKSGKRDIQRMRRQIAFDRLVIRLFSEEASPWVLKGGYALEMRLDSPRTTKDVDLDLRERKIISAEPELRNALILGKLRKYCSIELEDFFSFEIKPSKMNIIATPYGGARFPVIAQVDGRVFARFHLDVGIGNPIIEPLDPVKGEDWLAFAGLHTREVAAISLEQHFAEKIHAYTQPRVKQDNSRSKDLVDMVLLIRTGKLNTCRVKEAMQIIFEFRGTHPVPNELELPPRSWVRPFTRMAKECNLKANLGEVFEELCDFLDKCNS